MVEYYKNAVHFDQRLKQTLYHTGCMQAASELQTLLHMFFGS